VDRRGITMIYLRKAELSDVWAIMPIIEQARQFLKEAGSNQWQGTYPSKVDIEKFISREVGYVLVVDNEVSSFCALITGEDV